MVDSKTGELFVLGLTGGIASGKSAASQFLKGLGANVIDADKISRDVTAPGGAALPAIRELFGEGVFMPEDELDRAALAAIVFGDDAKRRALEGIIHPIVQQQTLATIREWARAGETNCILDVPLLYETGMDVICDEVWLVAAPVEEQVKRVMERGLTREEAEMRIDSQMPFDQKEQRADRAIWTDRSIQNTQLELESLWQGWLKRVERGVR